MSSSSSLLLRMFPVNTFDVHVLRTFTRDLNSWIGRLQSSAPHASETIGQLIPALNQTFREVELSYLVWRNDRVQTVLQHGFQYNRARIEAALWRRNRGRPAAAFPGIYTPFYYQGAGGNPQSAGGFSPAGQANSWSPAQGDPYFQANTYATAGPSAGVPGTPKVQSAQNYPSNVQQPYHHHRSDSGTFAQAGTLAGYSQQWPGQDGGNGVGTYYPPPPYPPPNWKPPSPVPGSPPVPTEVATAVDVACRYLEAVGKAVNVCIDLNAM